MTLVDRSELTCAAAAAPLRPSLAVVICAYTADRIGQIHAAVDSVLNQSATAAELIVVIDHNPKLAARLRQERPELTITENSGDQGLSGARNHGVAATSGDVVVFLDDDAVAGPGWLDALAAPYNDPRIIGVGGLIMPNWSAGRPRFMPPEFDWVVGCSYRGLPATRSSVRNVIGANMSFRRSALVAAGGFRGDLGRVGSRPAGCEETELSIRARHMLPGTDIVYEPTAVVHHHVPPTRANLRYFMARCYAEGGSKALVVRHAGASIGLETERAYVTRTLPRGIARGMLELVTRADPGGALRAATIVVGILTTAAGYVVGRVRQIVAQPSRQEHSSRIDRQGETP